MPAERLQKLLARSGVASRRGAEALIAAGRVSVNGLPAVIGQSVDPVSDRVAVDGRPVGEPAAALHLALHKPAGYLSATRGDGRHPSALTLIGTAMADRRLWPAGRLDLDSEGLLLVTDDGVWAQRVLHPRYGLRREYAVLVDPAPDAASLARLRAGVTLDDGPARLLAARRTLPPPEVDRSLTERGRWLRVEVGEGRNREVRRLFAAVGSRVERLVRTAVGEVRLDGLRPAQWRPLSEAEVASLAGRPAHATGRGTRLTVAIDGPSGSGKSTIGYALARRLRAAFVDTGLLYRALTLAAFERGVDPEDHAGLAELANAIRIQIRRPASSAAAAGRRETVLLDGRDVTDLLRAPHVDRAVPTVSRHSAVRAAMLDLQRSTARRRDTVMVGRDIGTVVLPEATVKVFLTASTDVRARRRAAEMGRGDRLEKYRAEIEARDASDIGRPVAPLRRAPDALVLDTGELDVDACVDAILAQVPTP